MNHKNLLNLAAAAALLAGSAQAHVTLTKTRAAPGTHYKAVLRVPHGCSGSATTELRVRIPEGLIAVRPQPRPGWALSVVEGKYAQPQQLHDNTLEQGVREIAWRGKLPDAWFDEFALIGYLMPGLQPGQTLYFPVVQQCEQGVVRWIDTSGDAAANPAPALHLVAPAQPGQEHAQ